MNSMHISNYYPKNFIFNKVIDGLHPYTITVSRSLNMCLFIYLTGDFIHKLFEDNAFVPTDVAAGK